MIILWTLQVKNLGLRTNLEGKNILQEKSEGGVREMDEEPFSVVNSSFITKLFPVSFW